LEHERLTQPNGLGFRADVEGLRAICVLAVVAYHVSPMALPGGFLGVDLFFVISGFVITRLLLADGERYGRVQFAAFWERRIRRILPVVTVVLLATALAILAFPVLDGRVIGRDLIAAALFFHNIRQMDRAVDYLGAPPETNPTLHFWSLAVEEQFYLVWPLVLTGIFVLAARARSIRWIVFVGVAVALLTAALFLVSVWLTNDDPAVAFFHPAARAWQLLAGGVVACLERGGFRLTAWGGALLAAVSAAVIAWLFLVAPFDGQYPGLWSAAPTLAGVGLLLSGQQSSNWFARVLALAPLRFIGRISFSLYLWHWPALVFARVGFGESVEVALAAVALAVVLSILSFYVVEQPVRHWRAHAPDSASQVGSTGLVARISRRAKLDARLVPGYALGVALIAASAATGAGLRFAAPDYVAVGNGAYVSASAVRRDRPAIYDDPIKHCLARFDATVPGECAFGAGPGAPTVVLLGDSHAGNWFEALRAAAVAENWRLLVRVKASCRPLLVPQTRTRDGRTVPYPECSAFLAASLDDLRRDPAVKLIVTAGTRHRLGRAAEAKTFAKLAEIAPVIVVRDTPWLPVAPVQCARQKPALECVWPLDRLLRGPTFPQRDHDAFPDGVRVLDLNGKVCPNGACRAIVDGWPIMFDNHHFTGTFSRRFEDDFRAVLRGASAPERAEADPR
jgi:peptidoglycan/LPS O-acetylase OafA/YrhL